MFGMQKVVSGITASAPRARASSSSSDVPPPPTPPTPPTAGAPQQKSRQVYGLSDEEYSAWKRARTACEEKKEPLEALKSLSEQRRDLLNYRSPVDGQTLLLVLANSGASEETLDAAIQRGCLRNLTNAGGETAFDVSVRKFGPKSLSSRYSFGGPSSWAQQYAGPAEEAPVSRPRSRASQLQAPPMRRMARTRGGSGGEPEVLRQSAPPQFSSLPSPYEGRSRKAGYKMQSCEVKSVPRATMTVSMELPVDMRAEEVEAAISKAYNGAQVQVEEMEEQAENPVLRRQNTEDSGVADRAREGKQAKRTYQCRVLLDDRGRARTEQQRSRMGGEVQQSIATSLRLREADVELSPAAQVDEVDAVTLKLDSHSSSILCGACLLYDHSGACEKVVHFSDRTFWGCAVQHSGDTTVNGKSVHTINMVLSKLPDDVAQIYFTLCACGPDNLSKFRAPSIMMYDRSRPDLNLLEYSIDQAGESASCVMARMLRKPARSSHGRLVTAMALRRIRMPLLCVDIVLAMSEETTWALQALGSPEWHLTEKICQKFDPCRKLIEDNLRSGASADSKTVGVGGPATTDA